VGRDDEAAPQLRAAREVFDQIGARRWSRCAADALARLDPADRIQP
jgi:hypothetical protein